MLAGGELRQTGEGIAAHRHRRQALYRGRSAPTRAVVQDHVEKAMSERTDAIGLTGHKAAKLQQAVGALLRMPDPRPSAIPIPGRAHT